MKERILELNLTEAIELFSSRKWNLYTVQDGVARLEAPIDVSESWIVEVPVKGKKEQLEIERKLNQAGWIKQRGQSVRD